MAKEKKKKNKPPTSKTYGEFRYTDLSPNPLNPRRIFDKLKLDILEESIRANKILVPLTVYRDRKTSQLYILDGERRWRCAHRIETGEVSTKLATLPRYLNIPPQLESLIKFDPDSHELSGTLSYESTTNILIHHEPINRHRYDQLIAMSDTKGWQSAVDRLYAESKAKPPKEV